MAARREVEESELERLEASAKQLQVWAGRNDKFSSRYLNMQRRTASVRDSLTETFEQDRRAVSLGSGKVQSKFTVTAEELTVRVDAKELFELTHWNVAPGENVAIVGLNGAGKTTFLNLIFEAFLYPEKHPQFQFSPQVRIGYYDQKVESLDKELTVLSSLVKELTTDLSLNQLRSELVRAGFPYEVHNRKVKSLSGGERARLKLLALKLDKPNLLLLDEPTNHIDVQGIEQLEYDMISSDSTFVFVSHDRRFLNRVADRVYLIHQGEFIEIDDVQFYLDLVKDSLL